MWVEMIERASEILWPNRWEMYQQARYDYEGYIKREEVKDMAGAEIWCPCPGKRVRMVEIVNVEGRRVRVTD